MADYIKNREFFTLPEDKFVSPTVYCRLVERCTMFDPGKRPGFEGDSRICFLQVVNPKHLNRRKRYCGSTAGAVHNVSEAT